MRGAGSPGSSRARWSVLGAPPAAPARDCFLRKDSDTSTETPGPRRCTEGSRQHPDHASPRNVCPGLGVALAGGRRDELRPFCAGALRSEAKICPRGCLGPSAGTTSSTTRWGGTRTPWWPASLKPAAWTYVPAPSTPRAAASSFTAATGAGPSPRALWGCWGLGGGVGCPWGDIPPSAQGRLWRKERG